MRCLPVLLLSALACACAPEPTPPESELAGTWRAASPLGGDAEEVLALDGEGEGTATLYRVTPALVTKLDYDVTASDDDGGYALAFRCNGRTFMCERDDFDTTCTLDEDDRLTCEAPPWRENADVIAFARG